MPDKFVFSNFAVSTLRESIGPADTTLLLNVDDVPRFPVLSGGAKFPLVLADSDDVVEIVYVTALSGAGTATIERGREGTHPEAWLGGTQLSHTFTAATVRQAAGLNPRGPWSALTAYEPNDVVEHGGASWIAETSHTNSAPAEGNVNWQPVYRPVGTSAISMMWQRRWQSGITYSAGQVVEYNNRIWESATHDNSNQTPFIGSPVWAPVARGAGDTEVSPILIFQGLNNYSIALTDEQGPVTLFDGLKLRGRVNSTNTSAATLTITRGTITFPAVPLRVQSGLSLSAGDIVAGQVYEWSYNAGGNEFLATRTPGLQTIPAGVINDYAGSAAPDGWLMCFGQAVSRTDYARLFAVIGSAFGAGDGSSTFNIPDFRGRVSAGADNMGGVAANRLPGYTLGVTGGAYQHVLTTAELPSHGHVITDPGHIHGVTDPGHGHGVTDPGHGHTTNNPAHSHGVTDPGHDHAITDPGHSHSYNDVQPNYSSAYAAGVVQASNNSGDVARTTISAATGIDITAAVTGLTIQNATTNVSVNTGATGISINSGPTGITVTSGTTGITVQASGGGNAHANVQPTIALNKIIKT